MASVMQFIERIVVLFYIVLLSLLMLLCRLSCVYIFCYVDIPSNTYTVHFFQHTMFFFLGGC